MCRRWLAPQMCRLYDRHLGVGWQRHSGWPKTWEKIESVDDGELVGDAPEPEGATDRVCAAPRAGAGRAPRRAAETLKKLGKILSPDALTIGFARRFATYKRANLVLADIERLASMVNDPKRPVQFLFAGKAHPHDEPGKKVLQQIAEMMRDSKFSNKFVFIEDYDINVGRYLVQGVDVWLNNPRRPLEASGTSGQKVVLNGGLNLSVLDGWWAEAYDGLNGFAIGTGRTHSNMDVHDSRDGEDLYRVLHDEVIPLFYQRDRDGLPRGWIKRMKRTIRTLGWRFNADRMVMDYTLKGYIPARRAGRRARFGCPALVKLSRHERRSFPCNFAIQPSRSMISRVRVRVVLSIARIFPSRPWVVSPTRDNACRTVNCEDRSPRGRSACS
jgi:starch phosphorylase